MTSSPRKVHILLAFFTFILSLITGEARCRYQCGATNPSQYGATNLAPGSNGLPLSQSKGYSPVSTVSICNDTEFEFSPAFHILPTLRDSGAFLDENFLAFCPSSAELKLFHANLSVGTLEVRNSITVPGDDEIVGYFSFGVYIAVLSESSIFLYEMSDTTTEGISLKWKHTMEGEESFYGMPAFSKSYVVASYGTSVVFLPVDFSGSTTEVKTIATGVENSLGYVLLDKDMIGAYFCSESGVHKVSYDSETSSTINLESENITCSALVLSDENTLVVAANKVQGEESVLASIDTIAFDTANVFVSYDVLVYGMGHMGWNDMSIGEVGLFAMTTSSGIQIAVNELLNYSRGDLYSRLDSPNALTSFPTISSGAEPVLFTSEGVLSYTATQLVKFFSLELGLGASGYSDVKTFEDMNFVSSPLLLGSKMVVAFTTTGEIVLYTQCNRYYAGEEAPENACPIAELNDASSYPYWMLILTAVSAGFVLPGVGLVVSKSKLSFFDSEENVSDLAGKNVNTRVKATANIYSSEEDEDESYTPVKAL